MKNRILLVAAILGLLATSCKKENENSQNDLTETPITISANYGGNNGAKVSYTESGNTISATWDAGDQLYVVYNGHVNTLTLTDGAGTASATFTGSIIGTPTAMSVLICYVRDAKNASAVTVSPTGEYTYTSGTFLNQDGTLEGAAKCNLYYGTTTYGTGSDISCTFSPNTSMLKFSVTAPDGVSEGAVATLTYKSGETELAKATFTVGLGYRNTVYMTIPAGSYTGEQNLVYLCGETEETQTLSSSQANFVAGQTYSKSVYYGSFTGTDLNVNGYANCYIVSEGGMEYRFKATVKGNGGLDPMTGTTATAITGIADVRVLWELNERGKAIKYANNAYSVRTDGTYVYFFTPETFAVGNACIAVVDAYNNILWSWHIWATPEPGTITNNNYTFMDRNLGGIDVGNCMRGFLYQWGRKDPFSAANGGYSTYTYVPDVNTAFNSVNGTAQSMEYTIANPTTFVYIGSGVSSWLLETEYNKQPWKDDVKTIYDPCPIGWRVPINGAMNGITGLIATGASSGNYTWSGCGFGNPNNRYYWTSTQESFPKVYYYDGGNSRQDWNMTGMAIRPVHE